MGLASIDTLKPVWKIEVVAGTKSLSSSILEGALMKLQYVSRQGKGQVPRINMEFDNSSGKVFNPLVMAVGLKLRVSFGYDGYMSRAFTAPVKSVKALAMRDPGREPDSPRPDVYGTVLMEMHLHKHIMHLHPEKNDLNSKGPIRISEMARKIARWAGYRDDQIHIQTGLGMGSGGGPKEETVSESQIPDGETAMQFLRKLAVQRGFWFSATEDGFHFRRLDWQVKPVDVISYFEGPDVLSFNVEGDYALNANNVKGKAINPRLGQFVYHTLTGTNTGMWALDTGQSSLPIKGAGGTPSGTQKVPDVINPTDLVSDVSSRLLESTTRRMWEHAHKKWTIKLTTVGNPLIFEGDAVVLDNFSAIIDGIWIVTEVEHRIDGEGYTTLMTMKDVKKGGGPSGPILPVYVYDERTGTNVGLHAQAGGVWKQGKHGELIRPKAKRKTDPNKPKGPRPGTPLFYRGSTTSHMRNPGPK